jgi:hypothetical protein
MYCYNAAGFMRNRMEVGHRSTASKQQHASCANTMICIAELCLRLGVVTHQVLHNSSPVGLQVADHSLQYVWGLVVTQSHGQGALVPVWRHQPLQVGAKKTRCTCRSGSLAVDKIAGRSSSLPTSLLQSNPFACTLALGCLL